MARYFWRARGPTPATERYHPDHCRMNEPQAICRVPCPDCRGRGEHLRGRKLGPQHLPFVGILVHPRNRLPAGAQFLNVIESIFSGMARAVIHNSNYKSKDDAKCAIDRYFTERNEYYRINPQRAGKQFRVVSVTLRNFLKAIILRIRNTGEG